MANLNEVKKISPAIRARHYSVQVPQPVADLRVRRNQHFGEQRGNFAAAFNLGHLRRFFVGGVVEERGKNGALVLDLRY